MSVPAHLPEFALVAAAIIYVLSQGWNLVAKIITFFDRRAEKKKALERKYDKQSI